MLLFFWRIRVLGLTENLGAKYNPPRLAKDYDFIQEASIALPRFQREAGDNRL